MARRCVPGGHAGPEGLDAVRGALDTPLGPSAWLFLASIGEVAPEDVPPGAPVEAGIISLLATLDAGTPQDLVAELAEDVPGDAHAAFLDRLVTAEHPRTAEVFEQIGRHHPDKAMAKHARKLAHRWRSAHGGRHG